MGNMRICLLLAVTASLLFNQGCSKEDRDAMIDRATKAAKGLNGDVVDNTKEHDIPTIVADQRKKERVRQNTKWTAENQRLHPLEYCQAQLEEIDRMGKQLDVQEHKLLTTRSSLEKKIAASSGQAQELSAFLAKAKEAYKEAEIVNGFPIQINGHSLSKEKAQQAVLEANRKLKGLQAQLGPAQKSQHTVEQSLKKIQDERQKLMALREKLKETMNSVQLKQTIDGASGVDDALQAIDDSMNALQPPVEEPSVLDELMTPDEKTKQKDEFEALMKN